ncbi:MAG: hypothetical protein HZA01_00570 [Nitrospinae bacterium]|nr:hypothetical protein [Nitrospinota bacterium]
MERAADWVKGQITSVKVGPVSFSTTDPKATIGAEVGVAGGIEVSAEASVEVLTTGGTADDLLKFTVSGEVKQSFLSKLPFIGGCFSRKIEEVHTAGVNPELVDSMNTNVNKYNLVAEDN